MTIEALNAHNHNKKLENSQSSEAAATTHSSTLQQPSGHVHLKHSGGDRDRDRDSSKQQGPHVGSESCLKPNHTTTKPIKNSTPKKKLAGILRVNNTENEEKTQKQDQVNNILMPREFNN